MSGRYAPVSVRRLLFRWLFVPLGVLLAIGAVTAYPVALYPATAAYDWALMDTALSLSRMIAETPPGSDMRISHAADILLRTDQFDRIYYAVHDEKGTLLAGDPILAPPKASDLDAGELLYDSPDGHLRIAALRTRVNGGDVVVQVAETTVKRQRLIARILTSMVVTEVAFLVAALSLVWLGIIKGMEPLKQLRAELEARSPRDLRPVEESHVAVELNAVVRAINSLLERLGSALQQQQRFVANVAHQLRTPLAGLRMHVETAMQQEVPEGSGRRLQPLNSAVERATHLVNQLLALARAEANPLQAQAASVDLSEVVQEVAAQWLPRTIAKRIDLGLELKPAVLSGDRILISELLSNLFDNAIAYVAEGGRITVRTRVDADMAVLEVEDDGPGIPEDERASVFQRFYRAREASGDGCGLGLAIVQEIAQSHGGAASLGAAPQGRGLVVTARFPSVDGRSKP